MASLSGIRLCPLDEGDSIEIPTTKTTVGRGSFLQVSDKRVSRNHATLEINDAGKLVIVPIHTNPCFFKMHGNGQQIILAKDKPKVLEHGDVLSLLPDKFFFQVAYSNEDVLDDSKKDTIKKDGDMDDSCEGKSIMIAGAGSDGKEMALPLGNKRVLPTWMKGSAKRTSLSQTEPKSRVQGSKTESNNVPASKMPSRPKTQQPISKARTPRKSKKSDSEELDLDEEEEEKPAARKGSRKRKNAGRRGRYRDDDDEDDEEEEQVLPIRRPRAASLKKPKYTDDDFVISDEELDLENMLSESERDGGGRKGKDEDSDFVLDEEDSGSDWESRSRKTKPKHGKFGRSSSVKGRRSQHGRRRRARNSDSFSDGDSDGYVPRLSKRRAAAAATTRMKASKVSDDDDDDDYSDNSDVETRKPKHKKAKGPSNNPRKRKSKRRVSDDEEDDDDGAHKSGSSDEEMDVDDEGTGKKKPRQDGKACYGKNQKRFEDLSHPQNDSGKGDDSESDEKKAAGNVRQKRAAAVRQQEKLAALHNESAEEEEEDGDDGDDDDGDCKEDDDMKKNSVVDEDSVNGNGNESRGSDSDFDPEDEEESAGRSRKVKHLMPNKLKQKAAV